jgi:hypothetical protein
MSNRRDREAAEKQGGRDAPHIGREQYGRKTPSGQKQ